MAVRWGAGEETLSTCNMDIFTLETLDETTGLRSGGTLDTLQGCLDPTILSMFEDTPAIDTQDLEYDTEATLLTALTEILDNVDDENLSPFDTLPESDLLSGQKGREHSPLRRLFCLSRSPPEKDVTFGRPRTTGKSMPMVQQRSDGEEEEDSQTPSPERLESSSDNELFDWEGLPITLEQQGGDELSVNLGDLVKHMHPYCMAISVEDDKGEQMLHEGGILLEVVDQGENGEPILAIPELDQPISVKLDELISNSIALDEADDQASDTSEHIVVDDDDDFVMPPVINEENKTCSNVNDKMTVSDHKDVKCKNNSQEKTKFNGVTASTPQPTVDRVLRNTSLKKGSNKKTSKKKLLKEGKNGPQDLNAKNTTLFTKPKKTTSQIVSTDNTTAATVPALPVSSKEAEKEPEKPPKAESVQQIDSTSSFAAPAPESEENTTAGPIAPKDVPCASVDQAAAPEMTPTVVSANEPSPPLPPAVVVEPKPKALSLAEYRRLRQMKKPTPIEKQDNNSTKWPSLPEMPRELPPIPCLPEPSPRDPRRPWPQSKGVEEVKPAWIPRGPGVPPTPEALLALPAYMVNSTVNKVSAATVPKPQPTASQTVPSQCPNDQNNSAATLHTEESTKSDDGSCATDVPQACHMSASMATDENKPVADVLTSMSNNAAASLETKHSLNSIEHSPKAIDSCDQAVSSTVNPVKVPKQKTPNKSEKSPAINPQQPKSPTQELIEAFTSEMGIEATDLTSLLEQFEETQAKEEQCMPEVSGRAVAVGNSSSDLNSEKNDVERTRVNDLSSTALTPPATPPHPMWKPLVPVSLLGKGKVAEAKSGLSKVIEIEAQPLPSTKARNKFTPSSASVAPDVACQDHDYCLPDKGTSIEEAGKRWNVKQNSSITIKPIKPPATTVLQKVQVATVQSTKHAAKAPKLDLKTKDLEKSSVLETPDASPTRDIGTNNSTCPKQGPFRRSYRQRTNSSTPSPRRRSMSRSGARRSRRSPSPRSNSSESDSSRSRSRSYTPPKKRYRLHRSSSSSSSRSRSRSSSQSRSASLSPHCRRRYSYSSSRSTSWSRSRSRSRSLSQSRSRSPQWSRKRVLCSPSYTDMYGMNMKINHEVKRRKEKAIEERRVVYVGRIRGTMTQKELKERFSYFGEIEECTLHFRDHGDNYGFVTYYNTNDAFMAIENGSKLRKPDEFPFDLCFGGRRQFCQTSYADLDSSKEYDPLPSRNKTHALDFDTLLKQAQMNLKR